VTPGRTEEGRVFPSTSPNELRVTLYDPLRGVPVAELEVLKKVSQKGKKLLIWHQKPYRSSLINLLYPLFRYFFYPFAYFLVHHIWVTPVPHGLPCVVGAVCPLYRETVI